MPFSPHCKCRCNAVLSRDNTCLHKVVLYLKRCGQTICVLVYFTAAISIARSSRQRIASSLGSSARRGGSGGAGGAGKGSGEYSPPPSDARESSGGGGSSNIPPAVRGDKRELAMGTALAELCIEAKRLHVAGGGRARSSHVYLLSFASLTGPVSGALVVRWRQQARDGG